MNKSINLSIQEHEDPRLKKRIRLLRLTSLSILSLVVLSAVALFFMILASPLPELRQQENAAATRLRGLSERSTKVYLIRERLGGITTILEERPVLDRLLTRIQGQLPEGVIIDSLRTDASSITITVSSPSLLSLNAFIDALIRLKEDVQLFSSITLSEVRYDSENPRYIVTVHSTL